MSWTRFVNIFCWRTEVQFTEDKKDITVRSTFRIQIPTKQIGRDAMFYFDISNFVLTILSRAAFMHISISRNKDMSCAKYVWNVLTIKKA